ncbi:ABC-three component system protein [uncultured Cycloclasticus sp.]|uniref:ABC-three component system protein n=1 Tax=uncultured Cycloclasticus sp. TaxID=172194 RepID=UPI00258843E6|nr:ABC-three component system protein [uncultured Cycloclasticus sp.]
MSDKKSTFDATSSMLGYIYQVRYGLYLGLKKLTEVEDPDEFYISIETLDDIAFEKNNDPFELLQTKFHSKQGNLNDKSPDLWKTIRVWVDSIRGGVTKLGDTCFTLVTTETASDNSIALSLCGTENKRDTSHALERLRAVATSKGNVTNIKGYEAFETLQPLQQEQLVESIYIIGQSDDLIKIRSMIELQLRAATQKEHLDAFVTRLEGIWFKRIIEVMSDTEQHSICLGELQAIIDDLRPQFLQTNLPIDFSGADPDSIDVKGDQRNFVNQLRLIDAPSTVIRLAIINYYRAYEQRIKWSSDGLLKPGELKQYDKKLMEEWLHHKSLLEFGFDLSESENKIKYAQKLYKKCQVEGVIPIRPDFKEPYVARGTYHELADKLTIGWHPEFSVLIEDIEAEGAA